MKNTLQKKCGLNIHRAFQLARTHTLRASRTRWRAMRRGPAPPGRSPSGETKKNSHEPKINSVSRRGPQKARLPGTYFRGRVTKKGSSLRGGPKAPWTRNANATKVTGTAQPRSTLQERTASVSTGDSKQLLLAIQHLSRTVQSNGQKFLLKKRFKALPLIMHEMKTTKIIRTKSK